MSQTHCSPASRRRTTGSRAHWSWLSGYRISRVELIPKGVVVGLFAATPPGAPDRDRLNRVWSELSSRQDYRQFTVTGDGAQLLGATPDDALVIQPPLVQVRSSARLGAQNAADEAQVAVKTVARHMGWAQFFNLGIKHVYHFAAPGNDAHAFLLQRLLRLEPESHANLERGGAFWAGLKYGATASDNSAYTVSIEPFLADNQFVFVDLDAQYAGPVDPDRIMEKAGEVSDYAIHSLRPYLEAAS